MMMPRGVTEIDRLIEQGLTLYGEGDLDGALLLWERVLVIDPDNPQANSYVEYVRLNYELLTGDGSADDGAPFGIGNDEPEYQIEILPGEEVEPAVAATRTIDQRDEGWVIGDDNGNGVARTPASLLLELEADEPPLGGDPGSFESAVTGEAVSFEDATREYPGGAGRPARTLLDDGRTPAASPEFVPEITPAFGSAEDLQTPHGFGFGSQTTDVRRRDLGFVQPIETEHGAAVGPPELKMTFRTPGSQIIPLPPPPDVHRAPTADGDESDDGDPDDRTTDGGSRELTLDLDAPPSRGVSQPYDSLDLELPSPLDPEDTGDPVKRAGTGQAAEDATTASGDLIESLPTPRPPTTPTKPLPGQTRPPALDGHPSAGPVAAPATTENQPYTMQLDPLLAVHPDPQHPGTMTRDFSDKPTSELGRKPIGEPTRKSISPIEAALISAPTRELGLRGALRPSTDDETTGEVDIQRLRVARSAGKPDIVGMDPIDARSAEILEEIDRNAPASETREERTRRRITALLERATEWGRGTDLERAVTAVDLALSEDPNSALAQKLIHRNRETIMTAFQGFLGDLQRAPSLARPLHELGSAPISPRAAFLLSRVDGTLSLDEILDVSGMPRLEAYRYLCQLFLRGILR